MLRIDYYGHTEHGVSRKHTAFSHGNSRIIGEAIWRGKGNIVAQLRPPLAARPQGKPLRMNRPVPFQPVGRRSLRSSGSSSVEIMRMLCMAAEMGMPRKWVRNKK